MCKLLFNKPSSKTICTHGFYASFNIAKVYFYVHENKVVECDEHTNKIPIKFNINIPLCRAIPALVNQQE